MEKIASDDPKCGQDDFFPTNPDLADILGRARALATYLILGRVGRGVRLGSERSSSSAGAGAGGVWKSGNLEIWEFGDLGTWKSRNLGSKKLNITFSQNPNPFCPKRRQGLEKDLEGPI